MTERTWFDGHLPALATDRFAVLVGGTDPAPAARRILAAAADAASPTDLLDALLDGGLAAVPAFAIVSLEEGRLTAFLRGPFVLRFETGGPQVWRVDGRDAHTWREVAVPDVTRAWAGLPDAEPRLLHLGLTPERPVRPGPTTAAGIVLRAVPAVTRSAAQTPTAGALARVLEPGADLPELTATVRVTSPGSRTSPPRRMPPRGPVAPPRTAAPGPRMPRAIVLPDGARVPIEGTLLVGRGPRSPRVDGGALPTLVPLPAAPRDISRSHVKIWSDGTRVQIEDLATTGGTALVDASGVAVRLLPARPAEVAAGATAELPGGARIRFVGDE